MTSISSIMVLGMLIVIALSAAAFVTTLVKPGSNAQAIRAVSVVAIFTMNIGVALAAAVWAVLDFILPTTDIKITAKATRKK